MGKKKGISDVHRGQLRPAVPDAAATAPEKQPIVEEGQALHASPMSNEHVNSRFGDYIPDVDLLVHGPTRDDDAPLLGEMEPPVLQTKKDPRHVGRLTSPSDAHPARRAQQQRPCALSVALRCAGEG